MPAVSKGDGMRGLAVFISDIRNCEWRLRRGGAGAWAGPAVVMGRRPAGPGLLSLRPLAGAVASPSPPPRAARSAPASRNGVAPRGAVGGAARRGGSPRLVAVGFGGFLRCGGLVGVSPSLPAAPGVVVLATAERGGGEGSAAVVVYKGPEGSRGCWECGGVCGGPEKGDSGSPSKPVDAFQLKTSLMESRPLHCEQGLPRGCLGWA